MANFKGKVERVRNNKVEGWAWHDGPDAPEVALYIDGQVTARTAADRMRGDLKAAGIGDGRGGFLIDIPSELCDGGLHKLSVKITGAADFLNAYPLVAVLQNAAEATPVPPKSLPPSEIKIAAAPVQAVAPTHQAATHRGSVSVVRGRARVVVSGYLADADLPAQIVLGTQAVTVTQLNDDSGFTAVFAIAGDALLPGVVGVNGVVSVIAVTEAAFHAGIRAGDRVTGHYLPLDNLSVPQSVRVRAAERVTLTLAVSDAGAVFDETGPLAVSFGIAAADLVHAAQARDGHFVLDRGQAVDIALVDGDDTVLAGDSVRFSEPVTFHLERASAEGIVGWMVRDDDKTRLAEIDIFLEKVRYATLIGDRHRQDVITAGHALKGGGFHIMPLHPDGGQVRIQFAPRFSRDFLDLKTGPLDLPAPASRLDQVYSGLIQSNDVTVLIPVRNDAKEARQRLENVLQHSGDCRILIIDDASNDGETADMLDSFRDKSGVTVHHEPKSLGPVGALNRGIELAGDDDVVIVSPGVSVGHGWLAGLRAAAYSDPRVATATPCSNHAGGFSVPEVHADNALPTGLRTVDTVRLVRQGGGGTYPRVPVGSGFCLYIRRDCLEAVGAFDAEAFPKGGGEDLDFCLRAARVGFIHVIDDRTFVYNRRWAPAMPNRQAQVAADRKIVDERFPEYAALEANFATEPPILAMRWRIRKAWSDHTPERTPRPRVAYVISTRSGGTPQTNRDLMQAIEDRYEPWVIACDSHRIELMRFTNGREETVETIRLDAPIHPASHASSDYDDAVAQLLLKYGFELVHIRHLGWHGIDLPRVCRTLGLPVVLSLHDFYSVCPNIKLLDQDQVFCGGKCTATPGDCDVELWPRAELPRLKHHFVHRWQAMFGEVFPQCDALVTTSEGARDIVRKVYPQAADADFRVIPHGRSFDTIDQLAVKPKPGERLRVLVPGNISPAKGSDLINAIVALDTDKRIEFHLLGDPGKVVMADTVIRHGLYVRDEFATKVAAIQPHIGAVLSIWPETYCHTLTEMWASGVPVAGIDIGAVGERLRMHGGGWLLPFGIDARAACEHLLAAGKDWDDRTAEVVAWQGGYNMTYGTAEMADAYDVLYRDLWRRQVTDRVPIRT